MRPFTFATLLMLSSALAIAQSGVAVPPAKPRIAGDYRLQMHVKIPMRDGVSLDATMFRPTPEAGPLPVVFMLSPYPDDAEHPSADYFARYGYIYAYVDVRGRGDSDGVFHPLNDAQDGYDVVEWFAKQPWCNGKVAMFGGSYAGGDQWQTASLHPPHLSTIVPVASVRPGVDFPFSNNIKDPYDLQWLTFTSGRPLYTAVFTDNALWSSAAKRLFLAKAAFNQFDQYAGSLGTAFQEWISHPEVDSYWRERGLTREQVAGITQPALAITGASDGDQPGTLSYYDDHIAAEPAALANYYLVIGPWNHPGTREPKADFGGEHYGPASLIDVLRLHREWYDATMKAAPKAAFLQDHVAYYVSGEGAECWKYAGSLATVSAKSETLYLDATGGAASLFHSGSLLATQKGASGGSFFSDPNDLSGAEPFTGQSGTGLDGQGLVFHSEKFEHDTEIDGKADLRLWLSIDAPDTDIGYELFLVTPDGKAHRLTGSVLRARYRHSLEHAEPIHENQPEEYRFPAYFWTARRAPKGSQLRLIVLSQNDPDQEKNWNSMKPVADQTGTDARVAHIKVLQDAAHPSTLTLPLGDPSAPCKASADW